VGAANANVAIWVVAAVRGEFEAGFDIGKGQTREHVLLAQGLGVSQVIVAINKLDVEGWSQERYREIQSKLKRVSIATTFCTEMNTICATQWIDG
jgi:translation elongation factor EF-1alpha